MAGSLNANDALMVGMFSTIKPGFALAAIETQDLKRYENR